MFELGKLYQIKRTETEKGLSFKAGDLTKPLIAPTGRTYYEIIAVKDLSFLMFVGLKTIDLPLCDDNECFVFWYKEKLVMFKKSDVRKKNYFHRVNS